MTFRLRFRKQPPKRLTGSALIEYMRSVPPETPKSKCVKEAGYVYEDGKPEFTAFYEALLEAKGMTPTSD